jgi:DNA polymerase III sliding clamp (beta) subunit (PCNA family)
MQNESTIHCTIPGSVLRAAACFVASNKDVRTYLREVCVTSKDGTLYVVATTGAAMAVFRDYRQSLPDFEVLMPVSVIKAIKKAPVDDCHLHITPAIRDLKTKATLEQAFVTIDAPTGASSTFMPSNDVYPAFLRVIPEKEGTYEHACFDVNLLSRFVDAKKALGATWSYTGLVEVVPRGRSATRVEIHIEPPYGWEFIGVITPMNVVR